MKSFKHKDEIFKNLKTTVDELVELNNLPILFGHITWGKLSKEGSFRLSYINRNTTFSGSLLSNNVFFNRHINQVGRNKTFLDFLLLYWYDNSY